MRTPCAKTGIVGVLRDKEKTVLVTMVLWSMVPSTLKGRRGTNLLQGLPALREETPHESHLS